MNLQLSIGITTNPRTWPILDGTVKPDGIDLIPTVVHPSELFWRQLRFAEFDVSEMSMLVADDRRPRRATRWVGAAGLHHPRVLPHLHPGARDAGIETPADLKGKRVGVPEFQQTAALWARGVLKHEFGVRSAGHGILDGAHAGQEPWRRHRLQAAARRDGESNPARQEHRLDAAGGRTRCDAASISPGKNLSTAAASICAANPTSRPLFPDSRRRRRALLRKTGIYPINHRLVVRRDDREKEPWVALNLLKAFVAANDIANGQRLQHVEYHLAAGLVPGIRKALETPLVRHGIKANRKMLETVAQYSLEQGLTQRLIKIDELYAPSVLES